MSSSPRRQGSRYFRSRSASSISFRSSRSPPYRNATQQTSDTGHRSPRHQRSSSSTRPNHRSPSPSPSRPAPRKRFGLNVPTNQPRFIGKFDFKEKYPEDPINEEMGPNARVWRAFLDECEVFDADMVTEARDGLDLHLVFAGLFSAVLTTFVAQTSQALSTNFPSVSTSLLAEMVALQRAQINGSPIDDILPGETIAGPSRFDIWVNALWFTSLTLSLARDRSLIRHYRFGGLQQWHVLTIIGTLPIVLHIALGLFLAGLVVFLIPLNVPLACIIGFITAVIYTMYIVSNILPLIYTHCPYRTPFSDILNVLVRLIRTLVLLAGAHIRNLFPSDHEDEDDRTPSFSSMTVFMTLKEAERIAATCDEAAEDVASSALLWLHQMTSNLPTKMVIEESLGCLHDTAAKKFEKVFETADLVESLFQFGPSNSEGCTIIPGLERRTERLLRGPGRSLPGWGLWTLDSNTLELPFQMAAAILANKAYNNVVNMGSRPWNPDQLLVHLLQLDLDQRPIRLPSVLWVRLISFAYIEGVPQLTGVEDDMFLLTLCQLALYNFYPIARKIIPFSGPVCVTDAVVPLFQFVVDLIVARLGDDPPPDAFNSRSLTNLFLIHNHVLTCLPPTGNNDGPDADLSVLGHVWGRIQSVVDSEGISENDTHVLRQRAEIVVLHNLPFHGGWWNIQANSADEALSCYITIIDAYHSICYSHLPRPEFFERLLADFCALLRASRFSLVYETSRVLLHISTILLNISNHRTDISVHCTLFLRSPFLSTRTLTCLSSSRDYLYPVVAAFISRFAGGVNMPREAALQCMDDLSGDPQRLYTVCRVIALGGDRLAHVYLPDREDGEKHLKQHLLHLVRFDPTHAVWTQRAHYMGVDPRDWPYLRLVDEELDDEAKITEVKKRMKVGLAILDEFFAAFGHVQPSSDVPHRVEIPRDRVRRFVPEIVRSFRALPSNVADVELGLRPSGRVSDDSLRIRGAQPPLQPSNSHYLLSFPRRLSNESDSSSHIDNAPAPYTPPSSLPTSP